MRVRLLSAFVLIGSLPRSQSQFGIARGKGESHGSIHRPMLILSLDSAWCSRFVRKVDAVEDLKTIGKHNFSMLSAFDRDSIK